MTDKTIIHVDGPTVPPPVPTTPLEGSGLYLDGDHPSPVWTRFEYDDARQALVLRTPDGAVVWPYVDMRSLPDLAPKDQMIVRVTSDPVARLVVTDQDDQLLIRSRAKGLGKQSTHVRRGRLMAWALGAVASVALIIFVLVPVMADQLAEFLPPEGEKALGDATFEQIRTALDDTGFTGLRICSDPDGLAALAKIEARLIDEGELETPLTVHVLDHPMINAFALPGGYVVFFDGLIQEAQTPEEVAAVFAHEVGHVVARDPTRIALRSAGSIGVLGLLLGDFAGGALVLFLAEQIIRADYTQEAEAAADTFAHAMLLDADLPPSAIGTFFERLAADHDEDPGIVQHFMSHPALGDRIEAARQAEPEGLTFRPVLTKDEWKDLRQICG